MSILWKVSLRCACLNLQLSIIRVNFKLHLVPISVSQLRSKEIVAVVAMERFLSPLFSESERANLSVSGSMIFLAVSI